METPLSGLGSRPATGEDVDWLLALRIATMTEHFERSGQQLSDDDQLARVRHQFEATRVLTLDGHDIGMIKVVREPGVWRLVQVQIVPEHQGKGVGATVVRDLLAAAAQAGVPVSLHVLKVNPARALYERLGFAISDDHGHSYEMLAGSAPGPA